MKDLDDKNFGGGAIPLNEINAKAQEVAAKHGMDPELLKKKVIFGDDYGDKD